ncbi:tudor domain-containing protein, partial [Plakobranchus ocellatus]
RATRPQGQVGILGSQSREAAEACLTMCPLLEDMAAWSQWGLVFQPQLGPLREFIEKYGGQRVITLKGKHGTMATSDFMALEVAPGKLLKICTFSGPEQFVAALEAEDPKLAAGHLVSLIVSNKGVEGAPLALLANHVKTKLLSLHAQSSAFSTPGGPPLQESQKHIDFAVQFVTKMLLAIPLRMCIAIAEQVLLKPLSEVVGSDKSKAQVLLACQSQTQDIQQLEQLGCLLGITEWWSSSLQLKMEFPADYCVTENPQGEDLFGPSLENEEEEDDKELESEDSDDESDIDDPILSGEENGAETENAEENNEKPEEAESLDIATALNDRNNSSLLRSEDKGEKSDSDKAIVDEEKSHDDAGEKENDDEDHDDAEADNADDALEEESYKTQEGSEDENVDKVGEAMEKILAVSTEKKEMTREEICHNIVDVIRREEFGVGIELGEAGQKLMKKQQERQGRSLQRLSKDLYSKDTHFVLELIQNADDNSYPQEVVPAVKFVIDGSGVKVMNNELGFEAKNIQALCDVGKSTKTKHTIGYIGQKGIGFKSVFRVTGRPEVHSNGFHICFDVDSGPMGYILPHWIEAPETSDEALSEVKSWQTLISLPWTEEIKQQLHTHAARFNDIKPSLLLFLHRLKKITIDNRVDGLTTSMLREDLGDGEIHISHSGVKDRWLVVRKILDASKVSIQMKAGVEVDSTEIALAFPLRGRKVQQVQIKPPMLPVFAFLPLRTYGFRFIIQGDFDVPSSREDVDKDSSWNQWLQSEIHTLFIEALEAFQKRPDLSPVDALIQYLQFIPLEGEVVDFFKPVTTRILAQLKASKCLPVLSPEKKGVSWKLPSQCVLVRDTLVREMVSPELLKHRLGLYYLHPEVSAVLDQPLADVLRVQPISTSHLLDIGGFISQNWDGQGNPEQVTEIAKWLACVYRSLDDFQENTHIMEELNKLRVIPLADGTLVAPNDATIFLLTESTGAKSKQNANKTAGKRDPLKELQKDLSLIHTALTNTPDAEINSQVVKLLMQTGAVKQLTAHDLVHCHIMEVFHSDLWREKSREVIISYLIYIKSELEKQPSLIDLSELKAAVQLATNHGIHSPEESSVYFTTAFGNKIDLPNTFPGVKWTLVDAAYLPPNPTVVEKQSWHNFLASLGVVDFLRVRPVEVQFDKETIHETPWAIYKDIWPDSPDGYTVLDYECKEFLELVSVTIAAAQQDGTLDCVKLQQVVSLFERLDSLWESQYSKFTPTQLRSGSGHILKEVIETSFAIHLKTLEWIPAEWTEVKPDKDGMHAMITKKQELCQSCDLFVDCPRVRKRLAHTVKYLKVAPQRNSSLINFLGIRDNVSPEETTEKFLSWCKRHPNKPNTPAIFCTTRRHIFDMYQMFNDELSGKGAQDVFHNNPAIFIPVLGLDDQGWHTDHVVVGKMMAREEVWWHDPLRLFFKYRESLKNFDSPLGNRSLLAQFYHGKNLEDIFQRLVRPEWEPSTLHLAQLLIHVATATTLFEEGTLHDCLLLFSSIGKQLAKSDEKVAGVASSEAIIAQRELQPVVSLLQDAAVFPSQRLEWVNPAHQLLMLPDSAELEKLFRNKPGVYFLRTDLPQNSGRLSSAKNCHLDKEAIQHFVSLFDRIKPISECVRAEEITTGFQQCIPGQTYLHKVIGLIQRFLYFVFPDVYREVKPGRAEALKQLMFVEVNKLEVRYELEDNPEIFEIRGEKCMIKDKMFYFHRAFTSSQNEINSEVAKHFSCGNKACIRELTSFLNQAGLILEAKSYDSMEDLLSRQAVEIGDLPADEEIWEIPLPIIQLQEEPEPEPQPDEPQMVYGKALDFAQGSKECTKTESGEDGQEQGLKSWPPRSSLTVDMDRAGAKKDSEKTGAPAGMWPPPRPPDSGRSTRALPSNIRVEREVSQEDGETQGVETTEQRTAENVHKARENDGRGHISRQSSSKLGAGQSGGATHHRDGSLESQRKSSKGTREWSDGEERRDGSTGRQSRGHHEPSSNEDQSFGEKRKRKASDSSREGEPAMTKRFNSQTDEISEMDKKHRPRDGGTMEGRPSARGQEFEERGNEPDRVQDNDLSHRDTSASSSGTSQDSPTKSRRDKRRMHFTVPMWSAINQDLEYTDLTEEISANLPNLHLEDLEQNDQAEQNLAVGRWGEMLVLDYLHKLKNSNPNIDAVLWANAEGEKGLPWDFEVIYTEGDNTQLTVYIEVKTTITADREMFEVSPRQLELALKEGRNFQVYRVFGAGKPEPRLLRIENVADKMNKKQIKLFMIV